MENNYEIPIVLFVFRRLDSVKLLMDIISKIKPQKLYIYADGAREGRDKEQQQVEEVRKYVCNAVNWKCESYIEFAQINKGCARNICEGLNEVWDDTSNFDSPGADRISPGECAAAPDRRKVRLEKR